MASGAITLLRAPRSHHCRRHHHHHHYHHHQPLYQPHQPSPPAGTTARMAAKGTSATRGGARSSGRVPARSATAACVAAAKTHATASLWAMPSKFGVRRPSRIRGTVKYYIIQLKRACVPVRTAPPPCSTMCMYACFPLTQGVCPRIYAPRSPKQHASMHTHTQTHSHTHTYSHKLTHAYGPFLDVPLPGTLRLRPKRRAGTPGTAAWCRK